MNENEWLGREYYHDKIKYIMTYGLIEEVNILMFWLILFRGYMSRNAEI